MNLKKDFGKRLQELRVYRGMTQAELAEKVGIDAKHMSHIETGRSFPKADLLERLSFYLNISITDIFNFSHYLSQKDLINEIISMLENADYKDVQKIFKIISAYFK